jgi:hypothetical protein
MAGQREHQVTRSAALFSKSYCHFNFAKRGGREMKIVKSWVLVCLLCCGMVFAAGCSSSSNDTPTTTNNNAQLSGTVKIEGGSNQQK